MSKSILLVLSLLFFVGCATKNEISKPQAFDYLNADRDLIAALVQRGSDVNKEHFVSYIIDCSNEQQVTNILANATKQGFEEDYVSYSEKNRVWSTSLSKSLKLNLNEISLNRNKLIPLMPAKGCKPIGWGASVVM
ncbi:MAG: ribonuclease E inhibitor RraB [Gammaproteobacteria bacterium]|nr:ribonuclease E inhibitor RraB [Gammaproteobacteria bacterium]